jgi:hypothetical protein
MTSSCQVTNTQNDRRLRPISRRFTRSNSFVCLSSTRTFQPLCEQFEVGLAGTPPWPRVHHASTVVKANLRRYPLPRTPCFANLFPKRCFLGNRDGKDGNTPENLACPVPSFWRFRSVIVASSKPTVVKANLRRCPLPRTPCFANLFPEIYLH